MIYFGQTISFFQENWKLKCGIPKVLQGSKARKRRSFFLKYKVILFETLKH